MSDFERARRTITTLLPVIDGIDAEGFLSDLEDELREQPLLSGVRATKRRDPQQRYTVSCRFSGPAEDVAAALERTWTRRLAYGSTQAHRLEVGENEVTLDFLTWREGDHCVTGRVTAARAGELPVALRIQADEGSIGP